MGVWNGEKDPQKKGGGVFSVTCLPGFNESTCFLFLFPGKGGGVGGWPREEQRGSPAGIISRKFGPSQYH